MDFLNSHHEWESIGFMWRNAFEILMKSSRFETPSVRKNGFYESICLYIAVVVGLILDNSR